MSTPKQPQKTKVVLVSHSDLLGGAAVVTYRLMQAMRRRGIDAQMLVYTKQSDDPNVHLIGSRYVRGIKFMWERVRIFLANGFNKENLFKVSIANTGLPIHRHPVVRHADIIMLGWVNQGMISIQGLHSLRELNKPIIWTMHDMWEISGICHHAFECRGYNRSCGNCQFLTGRSAHDLSHKVWELKKEVYSGGRFSFVAVSNWLANRARNSSLLKDQRVKVIPNAFPIDSFTTVPGPGVLPPTVQPDKKIILMGAARLDDPIKGLDYAITALNHIFDNNPKLTKECQAVFFGTVKNPLAFENLRFPYVHLGRVNDPMTLRKLFASAKVVLSTSLYETLPGTLIEGQASGCLPVTFGRGGQDDIVTHLKDGYIAEYRDPESIAKGIEWAMAQNPDRDALHESVRERFSSDAVVDKYIELFKEVMAD